MGFYIGCGLVLSKGDKFVLVQETRKEKAGLYNLPAGTLETHEDLLTCITREALEETGANVQPDCFVGLYQTVLEDGNNILFFVFGAEVAEGVQFASDEHEVISVFSFDEIVKLGENGQLRSAIVMQSIKDYQRGVRHPLSIIRTYHLSSLDAITVDKDDD